jgi:hypothetical protein
MEEAGRRHHRPRLLPEPESERSVAFRNLYDNLHLVTGRVPHRVILAGTSELEGVDGIVEGLARHALACGRDVMMAALELDGERPVLRVRNRDGNDLAVELSATNLPSPIDDLIRVDPGDNLVLVTAPPLTQSIQAALLARESDGLVLVVQPLSTLRSQLQLAVDRANRAGCALLGIVLDEIDTSAHESRLTRLRRRLFGRK